VQNANNLGCLSGYLIFHFFKYRWQYASFRHGLLLASQEHAIITPLIEKTSLEPDELKNSYRPMSNLTFISKVDEQIVAQQLSITFSETI
jgi:hypothetical protein